MPAATAGHDRCVHDLHAVVRAGDCSPRSRQTDGCCTRSGARRARGRASAITRSQRRAVPRAAAAQTSWPRGGPRAHGHCQPAEAVAGAVDRPRGRALAPATGKAAAAAEGKAARDAAGAASSRASARGGPGRLAARITRAARLAARSTTGHLRRASGREGGCVRGTVTPVLVRRSGTTTTCHGRAPARGVRALSPAPALRSTTPVDPPWCSPSISNPRGGPAALSESCATRHQS
mmetsp:Transcript_23937/g.74526  ORF Transcript_23937/g.74526 Transcript_23937/m.74526 type:complete len:235 (-) Transcript_23937:319-1023(-)